MVSEPWLLTRTSKCPSGLAPPRRSRWAARECPPVACRIDATLRPLPCGAKRSTSPLARAATTWPARQGLRGQHLLAGEDHLAPAAGVDQVEPHQVSAGRHRVAQTAVAHEGGWLDQRAAQVEQTLRVLVIEEAAADARQQGDGAAAAVEDREIGDAVAGQIAPRSPRSGRRRRTSNAARECPPSRRWRCTSRTITETSLLPWSAISMSGMPSPVMSATVTLAGAVPTK